MNIFTLFFYYFYWHYTRALLDIISIWRNLVWFVWNYFSISLLFRTLFSPWRRLGEQRKGFFDPVFLVIDIFMRIFGAIIRSIMIFIGLLFVSLFIIMGPIFFIIWIALPVIVFSLLSFGIMVLMK